jgi:hypothetical protein
VKYLETTVTNRNLIQEEIKRRMNSGNACYNSAQQLLSFRLLSKNVQIRQHMSIILPVVPYGYETLSLTLRVEQRLRVFENRLLRSEVTGGWRNLHNEEVHNFHSLSRVIRIINLRRMK